MSSMQIDYHSLIIESFIHWNIESMGFMHLLYLINTNSKSMETILLL